MQCWNQNQIWIETSFKLHSNITLLISGATAGLVYAKNGPLQQVLVGRKTISKMMYTLHAHFLLWAARYCGGPWPSTSLEKYPTPIYAWGVQKPKVETEDCQNTWHWTIWQVMVKVSPDADEWLCNRWTESNNCRHTPKIDLNIVPSCQCQHEIGNTSFPTASLVLHPFHTGWNAPQW